MEIKFRAPHAIDATLSPWPRRLDGVEAHEGPRNFSGTHWLISTQRVTFQRRLGHRLGRRRLDDLGLARLQGVEARRVGLEEVLELDALLLRQDVLGDLVLVLVLLRLLALGLLGLLRLGESEFGASWAQRIRWSMILKCYCGRP